MLQTQWSVNKWFSTKLQLFLWRPSQTITQLPSKLFNNHPLAALRPYTHYIPTTESDQSSKFILNWILDFPIDHEYLMNEWEVVFILEMYRIIFKMSFSCPDRTAQYVSWISFDFGTRTQRHPRLTFQLDVDSCSTVSPCQSASLNWIVLEVPHFVSSLLQSLFPTPASLEVLSKEKNKLDSNYL